MRRSHVPGGATLHVHHLLSFPLNQTKRVLDVEHDIVLSDVMNER